MPAMADVGMPSYAGHLCSASGDDEAKALDEQGLLGSYRAPPPPRSARPSALRALLRWGVLAAAVAAACCLLLPLRAGALRSRKSSPAGEALIELAAARPAAARRAEELRRLAAKEGDRPLLTLHDVRSCEAGNASLESSFCSQSDSAFSGMTSGWDNWPAVQRIWESLQSGATNVTYSKVTYLMHTGFSAFYPLFGFVQGFPRPGIAWSFSQFFSYVFGQGDPKWKPPVKGETMGVISYQDYAKKSIGKAFAYDYFDRYFTGDRIPSWEDNTNHDRAMAIINAGMSSGRATGTEPMDFYRRMEPRFALDNEALISAGWDGFSQFGPRDIKYASNGVWGVAVIEALVEKYGSEGGEVLGPLMTDSVFSVHLKYDGTLFHVDMTAMEEYTPIPGYAPLGGKAAFKEKNGSLHMVRLEYNGNTYTQFTDAQVASDYNNSKRSGWRFAEGALIASLLSQTNLVLHVKDLHLELAAAFQAVTVDAFAEDPSHPLRKLLDPFIHRSVQATNDNFKLLFEYHAAEFSLAPLPTDEQLRLIGDFIRDAPLNLAEMDLEQFGKLRNMSHNFSTCEATAEPNQWCWRWHYRALSMQRLYDEFIKCRLADRYSTMNINDDAAVQAWWTSMVDHMPALRRATELNPEWAPASNITFEGLTRVLRTLLVWLSWIHEDVGHSAASYVYNPVHTPMNIPEDGVGVPLFSYVFNTAAYRGFVFLERAQLLDTPPSHWFDSEACSGFWMWKKCWTPTTDKGFQCFTNFQQSLKKLGDVDKAFSECDKTGFYSCVNRVETAVSS